MRLLGQHNESGGPKRTWRHLQLKVHVLSVSKEPDGSEAVGACFLEEADDFIVYAVVQRRLAVRKRHNSVGCQLVQGHPAACQIDRASQEEYSLEHFLAKIQKHQKGERARNPTEVSQQDALPQNLPVPSEGEKLCALIVDEAAIGDADEALQSWWCSCCGAVGKTDSQGHGQCARPSHHRQRILYGLSELLHKSPALPTGRERRGRLHREEAIKPVQDKWHVISTQQIRQPQVACTPVCVHSVVSPVS